MHSKHEVTFSMSPSQFLPIPTDFSFPNWLCFTLLETKLRSLWSGGESWRIAATNWETAFWRAYSFCSVSFLLCPQIVIWTQDNLLNGWWVGRKFIGRKVADLEAIKKWQGAAHTALELACWYPTEGSNQRHRVSTQNLQLQPYPKLLPWHRAGINSGCPHWGSTALILIVM